MNRSNSISSSPREETAFRVPAALIIVVALSLSVAPLLRDSRVAEARGPEPREGSISPKAQPPAWNVELISRVDGAIRAVAVGGNCAYIGDGSGKPHANSHAHIDSLSNADGHCHTNGHRHPDTSCSIISHIPVDHLAQPRLLLVRSAG